MIPFISGILIGMLAALGALLWLIRNAPVGYEDETGWHPGTKSSAGSGAKAISIHDNGD